jgi:hypothetical protein
VDFAPPFSLMCKKLENNINIFFIIN